jgi:hypothetical protein
VISRAAAENITPEKVASPAGERDLPLFCGEAKKYAHPESGRTRQVEEELLTSQQQPEHAARRRSGWGLERSPRFAVGRTGHTSTDNLLTG